MNFIWMLIVHVSITIKNETVIESASVNDVNISANVTISGNTLTVNSTASVGGPALLSNKT